MLIAFPESKGYSVRNLKYMAKFAETYPDREFVQQVVAQIPWGHNIVLLDKVADMDERKWYIKKSAEISKFKSAPSHFQYQNHLAWRGLHGLRQADVLVCAHKNDKKKNSKKAAVCSGFFCVAAIKKKHLCISDSLS